MSVTDRVGSAVDTRVRASHLLAGGAALVVLSVARTGPRAFVVATLGCLGLVAGLAWGRRSAVVLAGVALFAAAVLVAAGGGGVLVTLVAAFAAVLAADFGTFAFGLDRDVDPSVATTRVELLHAVGSMSAAVVAAGVGYVLFVSVPAGSALGVVALLFGAVALAAVLR